MTMTRTYTLAAVEVSQATYDEVTRVLKKALTEYPFSQEGRIDMNGLCLIVKEEPKDPKAKIVLSKGREVYKVGEEPKDWSGTTVLGWRLPADEFRMHNEWRPVIYGRGYWSPGDDLDGHYKPTHLRLMPPAPEMPDAKAK